MHFSVRRVAPALVLSNLLFGCAADDPPPTCPGLSAPRVLVIANVSPEPGSTVPNDAIVHSFSVTDEVAFQDLSLVYTAAHTAGAPTPPLTFSFVTTSTSVDYKADDTTTWENAPAHVELEAPVIYQTGEGCAYKLPSPLFAYDLAEP